MEKGSIAGRILDASTGAPLSGVFVRLSPLDAQTKVVVHPAKSDLDGSFRFQPVPAGRYLIIPRKAGYAEDIGSEDAGSFQVKSNEPASLVLIRMIPLGAITGTVVDENDTPLAGVHMYALMLDPVFIPPRLHTAEAHAVTDRRGRYSISKLPGGSYYVLALPNSRLVRADNGYQSVPTFFPEASDLDDGARVFVQPGQTMRADMRIRVALTHRVEGKIAELPPRVRDDQCWLEMSPSGDRQLAVLRRPITIRADRSFLLTGIPSGNYEITLSTLREGHKVLLSKVEVDVGSNDVTGVDLTPMRPVTVTGLVRREDNNPMPIGPVGFRLVPFDEGISYGQPVGADGVIKIDGVEPNRYLFQVFPGEPGLYVSSLELNHQDVSNEYVDLSAGSISQVTAVLRAGTGVIRGTVTDGAEMVILAPESPWPDGSNIEHQTVRNGGTFEFRNVPPGDYFLYAARQSNSRLWLQPSFLNALKDFATPVHVNENEIRYLPSPRIIERSILRARAMSVGFYFE